MASRKIKQSPKLPADTRRDQLLKSARKLFLKKGYRMTTTEEIARNAGLTKGALYFHFRSKEDILFELIKLISAKYDRVIEPVTRRGLSPKDLFATLLQAHTRTSDLPDYRDTIDIWVQALRIPRIKRFIAQRINRGIEDFARNLDSAWAVNRKTAVELAVLTVALCDGLSVFTLISPSMVDLDAQARLFNSILEMYKESHTTRKR